jgi:TusA-related sulfurtransferase
VSSQRRLRKNYCGTVEIQWFARLGQQENTAQDAQKGRPARPQRAKRRRRTLRYVEPLSEARTTLADFFSILLGKTVAEEREVAGNGEENTTVTDQPDAELDLRGVICPYNFVKTKLKLEAMEQGQILSVLLDDGDPIRNVPRSVSDEGHTILSEDRVEGSYRVVIRRREDE